MGQNNHGVQGLWLGLLCKAHPDLHVVVGVDEPGYILRALQDENGVGIPGCTIQFHLYGHCPGPAAGKGLGQGG